MLNYDTIYMKFLSSNLDSSNVWW